MVDANRLHRRRAREGQIVGERIYPDIEVEQNIGFDTGELLADMGVTRIGVEKASLELRGGPGCPPRITYNSL
jgi:hypothetical protein